MVATAHSEFYSHANLALALSVLSDSRDHRAECIMDLARQHELAAQHGDRRRVGELSAARSRLAVPSRDEPARKRGCKSVRLKRQLCFVGGSHLGSGALAGAGSPAQTRQG